MIRLILALSLVATLGSCTPTTVVPATTSPTAVSTSTVAVTTASPTGQPTLVPARPGVPVFAGDGLTTFALGPLTGDIAFVVRPVRAKGEAFDYRELWAVPLDGGAPRLAAQYRAVFDSRMGDTNAITKQFSPDGRRIVLSVGMGPIDPAYQLMVLELASGSVTPLLSGGARAHDRSPAWSPDGRLIAFSRRAFPTLPIDGEIWVTAADGTGAKRLRPSSQGAGTGVYGWTADSRRIAFDPVGWESSGYALIDLDGRVSELVADRSVSSQTPATWRSRAPGFAGVFGDAPRPQRIDLVVGDGPSTARSMTSLTVIQGTGNSAGLTDPRWDPAGGEVILYRVTGTESRTEIRDLSTGTTISIGGRVKLAEWSATGDRVVTVEEHPSTAPDTLYVWTRDGRLVRESVGIPPSDLSRSEIVYRLTDLAVRRY